MVKIGMDQALPDTATCGSYFQGLAHYYSNRLAAAKESLSMVISDPSRASVSTNLRSTLALSLVHQAQGHPEQARELVASIIRHLLETGNSPSLAIAQTFQAELALRQGRLAEAVLWAETCETGHPSAGYSVSVPELTVANVLLSQGTATSLQQADDLLTGLHEFFASTHNTRFLIEVLALQAMLHDTQGNDVAALTSLGESITLAEPGGVIRLFVDLGPGMATLLTRLGRQHIAAEYIGQLLDAFNDEEVGVILAKNQALIDPLTTREIGVLKLLVQRLSNREIAEKLFISPGTVKLHTIKIYQKLDVHSRREAVAKARELELLAHD